MSLHLKIRLGLINIFICRFNKSQYNQNIKKQMLHSQKKTPRKIVDFRIANQHQIYYLVLWDQSGKSQEWVQDTYLVGYQKLINAFFTSVQQDELMDGQIEGTSKRNKKSSKSENKNKFKWNIDCSKISKFIKNKNLPKKIKTKGGKRSQKKYYSEDIKLFMNKIESLNKYIDSQRPLEHKLDYLMNYVVNVFKKEGVPYFTVCTFPPVRNLAVSLQHMQKYFPQTLKDYYLSMLKLHTRKIDQKQGGEDQESDEDNQIDPNDSRQQKIRNSSDNQASRGLYEEMSD